MTSVKATVTGTHFYEVFDRDGDGDLHGNHFYEGFDRDAVTVTVTVKTFVKVNSVRVHGGNLRKSDFRKGHRHRKSLLRSV